MLAQVLAIAAAVLVYFKGGSLCNKIVPKVKAGQKCDGVWKIGFAALVACLVYVLALTFLPAQPF